MYFRLFEKKDLQAFKEKEKRGRKRKKWGGGAGVLGRTADGYRDLERK